MNETFSIEVLKFIINKNGRMYPLDTYAPAFN